MRTVQRRTLISATFLLSAFGDEIDDDLTKQLDLLAGEGITALELRSVWGMNVLDLSDDQLRQVHESLDRYGLQASAIASPIGKSTLSEPPVFEQNRLDGALAAAASLGTRLVRIFSYYVPPEDLEKARSEVIQRLGQLTERATRAGATLLLENERGVYGQNPTRCQDVLVAINSPALRMAFDPGNFVQSGFHPMEQAWPLLRNFVDHVHIKDAVLADGTMRPAGQGDGDIPGLLASLNALDYAGYLTLEPHLTFAGPAGGYSGETGMRTAIQALRELLANVPNREQH
jgi:sugar phosphate isomerase/epimerase